MVYSFGTSNTSAPTLGFSTPAAKPAFGGTSFSFGSNIATTTATTGFTFGPNPTTMNPGGFSGFGTNPVPTNTGFGGFGSTATSAAPAFGGFGTTQTTSAPSLFGGSGAFGAPATTTPAFTGFGTNTSNSFGTQPTGFGTGFGQTNIGFGAPNTGFGTTNTGFGAPGTTTGFGGSTGTGFGSFGTNTGFGTTNTGFGGTNTGFGAPNTGFGTSFMNKPLGTGFGGFGTGIGGFGQPQPQPQPQGPANPHEALMNAVFNCTVFGDERDQILAKWNFLQAKWGSGKAYYANNQPPIELTEQNPLCRFKAIGYSCLPSSTDKDGLVQIIFNKTEDEIKNQQTQLVTSLNAIFGNKPNLTINIDSIKGMSGNNAQAMIYVTEKSATGLSGSRLAASEVSQYLNQPQQKHQMGTMGVTAVMAHVRPDVRHLQEYLNTPPPGIDPRLWNQAQADNLDPEKYLPVPMVGFAEVKWRMQSQEEETRLHAAFLSKAATDLAEMKAKLAATVATLQDQTRRHMHLHHRLLSVVVRQESARRAGAAMTHEEETLRSRLEALHSQLTAPTQFNGRLSELLSQMRMQRYQNAGQASERYTMDPGYQEDIKKVLAQHQKGMTHLIETVQTDLAHLKIIKDGMTAIVSGASDQS